MILGQAVAQKLKTFLWRVDDLEKLQILGGNRSRIYHGLKVNQALPVFAPINDDEYFLGQFLRLRESKDFEQLVHGPEAARKNYQSFGQIGEPELTHEEIVKLKIQRRSDVRIRHLLEGQRNIQAYAFRTGVACAEISCFHDAGTAPGRNYETPPAGGNLN